MPTFDGTDPDSKVFRDEKIFDVNPMTNNEKLESVVLSIEGEAIAWFQWEDGWRPFRG